MAPAGVVRMQVAVALLTLISASAAPAQITSEQQNAIRSSCRSDFMSRCSGVTPGGREALQCLRKNVSQVSAACQSAVKVTMPAPAAPVTAAPPAERAAAPAPSPPAAAAPLPPAATPAQTTTDPAVTPAPAVKSAKPALAPKPKPARATRTGRHAERHSSADATGHATLNNAESAGGHRGGCSARLQARSRALLQQRLRWRWTHLR